MTTVQSSLRQLMSDAFRIEEVKNICFDLGIDYENFPNVKEALIRELIVHCQRTGRLQRLLDLVGQKRPEVDWPQPLSLAEALGDPFEPKMAYEPETVEVPAGAFLMGSDCEADVPAAECPRHEVELPHFRIGRYPITNEEFAEYVRQTGHVVAPEMGWQGQSPVRSRMRHPVTGVTLYDALAYCRWLSEATGRDYRLATEAEWEKAARGSDGRRYPWGDEWREGRCRHGDDDAVPVDQYPAQSVYGCFDMVGNAREWTRSIWGEQRREPGQDYRYPWRDDARNDPEAGPHLRRVYKGGASADSLDSLRCSSRQGYAPNLPGPPRRRHGFRVVLYV